MTGEQGISWHLSHYVTRDRATKTIELSQRAHAEKFVKAVLGDVGAQHIKPNKTPLPPSCHPSAKGCPVSAEDREFMSTRRDLHRSNVASLLWLTRTRPDLLFASHSLCRFMSNPGKRHHSDLKRVARYVAGTLDKGLRFSGNVKDPRTLVACSDADWAQSVGNRRSFTGNPLMLAGGPVSAKSSQQRLVALSTFESEAISAATAGQTIVYTRRLLPDLGMPQHGKTTLNVDNRSCALSLQDSVLLTWRSRHIPLRVWKIREWAPGPVDGDNATGILRLQWVDTKQQSADGLTKSLGSEAHIYHFDSLCPKCDQPTA